jgi:hypothetical protein
LETTGIFFNEAREIDEEIFRNAMQRTGRYPRREDGGCTWSGIIMDTNPPDDRHWWYKYAVENTPDNWSFYTQPSGLSDEAENLENLLQPSNSNELSFEERRVFGRKYYERALGGATEEWINVYVHGQYGFARAGANVYDKAYNDDLHCAKEAFSPNPLAKTIVGIDASGRSPAAVFMQINGSGQVCIFHEFCAKDMGAVQFGKVLKQEIGTLGLKGDIVFWGDPAGSWKTQTDERTYFDILKQEGIIVRPSPGLRFEPRRQAMLSILQRLIDGSPALILSPSCKLLRRGFNGGYIFRKLQVSGERRYADEPEKNEYSHPHEALQYAICGLGELAKITRGGGEAKVHVSKDFAVY